MMRLSLGQLFGLFTILALIVGFLALLFTRRDGRVTVLAILCLLLVNLMFKQRKPH